MTRLLTASALVLSLAAGAAQAQSYTAPAGIPAATAPGGVAADGARARTGLAPTAFDALTTGSVTRGRTDRAPRR